MAFSPYVNAAWFTLFAVFYFRANFTSDRNYDLLKTEGKAVATGRLRRLQELAPVRLYDPRVILSALLVTLPAWLTPALQSRPALSEGLLLVALGAFLAPLTFPTIAPRLNDLRRPRVFTTKYLVGKFDGWLKGIAIGVLCFAATLVPGVAYVAATFADWAFPAIGEKASSGFFQEIVAGSAGAMLIMYWIRLTLLSAHGFAFYAMLCISTVMLWMTIQYYANEVLPPLAPSVGAGIAVLLSRMSIDLVNDFLGMLIEALE